MTQNTVLPRLPSGAALIAAGKLVVGDIPGEPPGFVDRAELAELTRLLHQRGRAVVCAGGRGVGKSAVAAAHARAAIADPAGPIVVVWVSGDSELALVTGLAVLAARANLTMDGEDADQAAARARDYLNGLTDPALLVVDNAEEPERIRRWLPASGSCRIVITSTDQTFTALAASVQVGLYTRGQSIDYLADRTGLTDRSGADQVADALGDLPLALAQAAGVISGAPHLSFATYLAKLTSKTFTATLPATPGYPKGLAQAVRLSVDNALTRHPRAATCLDIMAFLDPNGVTLTLLTRLLTALPAADAKDDAGTHGQASEDDIDDVIAVLVTGSLITVTADRCGVLMHRLVARVLREATSAAARDLVLQHAAAALQRALPGEEAPPPSVSFRADVAAQALALVTTATASPESLITICDAAGSAGVWLYRVGGYAEMLTLDETTLAARERILGSDHPDTLTSRTNLALGYREVGRYQDAIALDVATLAARERVLGLDHPDTLTSRNNLAVGYRAVGRYQDAIALDVATLAARERVLGPDHPDTLRSRGNLAVGYRVVGRYQDAITLDEATLATRERVLGPDHPDTLRSRGNLALGYRAVGRYQDAITLHEATLAARERALGPDHPDTLQSRNNLANSYLAMDRYQDAITLHEATLAARERILGPDHPDALTSRNNLANSYQAVGRHQDAITLHEATLSARERILGPDHPDTLQSRDNLDRARRQAEG